MNYEIYKQHELPFSVTSHSGSVIEQNYSIDLQHIANFNMYEDVTIKNSNSFSWPYKTATFHMTFLGTSSIQQSQSWSYEKSTITLTSADGITKT